MARVDVQSIYDGCLLDFFRQKLTPYYHSIVSPDSCIDPLECPPRDISKHFVFASPERPFGFKDNTEPVQDINRASQTLPTPLITLTRLDETIAMNRSQTRPFRKVRNWDDQRHFWVYSEYPAAWDVPYQVDILCRNGGEANKLLAWFRLRPGPVAVATFDLGYPWGKQTMDMIFGRIMNTSELEPDEDARWIRYTIPFTFESYFMEAFESKSDIPLGVNSDEFTQRRRAALKLTVQIYDMTGKELYTTVEVDKDSSSTPISLDEI